MTISQDQLNRKAIQTVLTRYNILIKEVRIIPADEQHDIVKISIQKLFSKSKELLTVLKELRKLEMVTTIEFAI